MICSWVCLAGDDACRPFEDDNRAGVDGMLHSIVAIRDRGAARKVIGLTFRIGRHISGKYYLRTALSTNINHNSNDCKANHNVVHGLLMDRSTGIILQPFIVTSTVTIDKHHCNY